MATTATASLAGYLSIVRAAGATITQEQEALLGAYAGYLDTIGASVTQKAEDSSGTTYSRPKVGTLTGKVWELADSLVVNGKAPERKEVLAAAKAAGINDATATTQWSHWLKAFKAAQAKAAEEAKAKAEEQVEAGVGAA
jgi:hypothetical protein